MLLYKCHCYIHTNISTCIHTSYVALRVSLPNYTTLHYIITHAYIFADMHYMSSKLIKLLGVNNEHMLNSSQPGYRLN